MICARVSKISLKVSIAMSFILVDCCIPIFCFLFLEFRRNAVNQENCQIKWLEAEDEVRHLKNQLSDANQMNSKLQAQYQQTTVLLKNEVKVRTHLQEEKKTLVNIFIILLEIYSEIKHALFI
jgi:hypothetical protein